MRRPRLPLAGLAGALIAGALLPLAFAPFGVYGLAPLSLAVLFALWYRAANARQGFALGYAFGLGQFGVGVSWLYNSLHLFGETIAPLAALVTLLFVAFVALFPALAGYLALRLAPAGMAERGGRSLLLLFPGVWGLVEWLRGRALGGFPWLDLGASQTDSLLSGYGPVLGEYGMGAAVTLSAGAALWWVMGAARARWLFAPLLLGLIWGGGAWLGGLRWVEADGAPIDVALVQGNVPQMRKFDPDVLDSTLRLYWNLSRQAADARLVLWPETAIPTVLSDVPGFMRVLETAARERGQTLLVGVFDESYPDGPQGEPLYYNAMLGVPRALGAYHKRHLVPFGEYLPLRFLLVPFERWIDVPMSDLTSGAEEQPLPVIEGRAAGVSICYEAALSREIRRALPQAGYLINASNDSWFGDSLAPHQHLQIARVRSLETGRPMARVTNTGLSALIDADGRLVAQTALNQEAVLRGHLQPMQGVTPFVRWGEAAVLALLLALTLGGSVGRIRQRGG